MAGTTEKQERKEFNVAVKSLKCFIYQKHKENMGQVYTVWKIMLGVCW